MQAGGCCCALLLPGRLLLLLLLLLLPQIRRSACLAVWPACFPSPHHILKQLTSGLAKL